MSNNYAFEIRFVDDNIVQVFDIAAKRQQQDLNNPLPTEYKQDEVLKGQLRYSKLVGSTPSTHQKDAFGLEDDGQPYKHIVTTKKSKNRRSTQRHTFFGMGGGGNSSQMIEDIGYDSGTAVSEEDESEMIELSSNLTYDQDRKQSDLNSLSAIDSVRSSHDAVSPTILESPTPVLSPPLTPPIHHQEAPEPMTTRSISPQLLQEPEPTLIKPRTSLTSPYRNSYNNDHIPYKESNHYAMTTVSQHQPVVELAQPISLEPAAPHVTIQKEETRPQQPTRSYPEDYASLSMVETNGNDSRQNMNQEHVEKVTKRGCCCIIS